MGDLLKKLNIHDNRQTEEYLRKAYSKEFETCVWGIGAIGTGFGKEILEEYGIQIDYYCDNRLEMINKEIESGIFCRSIDMLIENTEKTICFILVGYAAVGTVYKQLDKAGVKNIVTYDDLLELSNTRKKYLPFMNKKDTAIYTCITGDYDEVREPKFISDGCDYFLISDKKFKMNSVYQWVDINEFLPEDIKDPIYQNRYCKINAHKIFEKYRYSVYVDGNITITGNIVENINNLKKARLGVAGTNYTDNVYQYALRCIQMGADSREKIMYQLEHYWLQGLPENSGSFFCGVLMREHNNPICIKLMEEWWNEFCIHAKRDQISLPYVLWKNGFTKEDILLLCNSKKYDAWDETPYWKYEVKHKKERFKVDTL